jgi:catechol 2,3-dioxygenase-like lactoylglutathione lyase family enzyme
MANPQPFSVPPLTSFGIRVRDLEASIAIYSKIFGMEPFQITVFEPDKHWYRGEPCPIRLRIASFQIRPDFRMDLLQDLENGPTQWRIDENGEGVDYLNFNVDDYDLAIAHLEAQGFEILQNAKTMLNVQLADGTPPINGFARAAYLTSDKLDKLLIEIAHMDDV